MEHSDATSLSFL